MCLLFIPQSQAGCLEPPVHVPLGSTLKFQGCTPSPVQRVQLAADIHSYHRDLCAVTSIVCKSLQGATHRACRVHWLIGSLQAGCPEGFMDRPLGRVCKPVKRTVPDYEIHRLRVNFPPLSVLLAVPYCPQMVLPW